MCIVFVKVNSRRKMAAYLANTAALFAAGDDIFDGFIIRGTDRWRGEIEIARKRMNLLFLHWRRPWKTFSINFGLLD